MKKMIAALALAAGLPLHAGVIDSFNDIQTWAGDGASATNRAALVMQWNINATSYSYAWGFGWNSGAPTGQDMLNAIDLADTRLIIDYHPTYGALFGIFYDADGNGSSHIAGTPGIANPDWTQPPFADDVAGTTTDPSDLYQSGWVNGFWGYSNYDSSDSYANVVWASSFVGLGSRSLSDGSWDSLSFSTDVVNFTSPATIQPLAAVPEPSSLLLGVFALGLFLYARKRLHPY